MMLFIDPNDLNNDGTGNPTAIRILRGADAVFIQDTTIEEPIPAYGIQERVKPIADLNIATIELDTSKHDDLTRILNCIFHVKGYHEFFGFKRAHPIGTSPADRERDELLTKYVAIRSNRSKFLQDLMAELNSESTLTNIVHPASIDDALRDIDPNDVRAKFDAIHQVHLSLMLMTRTKLDVRGNLPSDIADAWREMGRKLAVECEAAAMKAEQFPNDPFELKPRGYAVRDSETGELFREHVLYEVAVVMQEAYQQQFNRAAEVARIPVEESYSLQRFMSGLKGVPMK